MTSLVASAGTHKTSDAPCFAEASAKAAAEADTAAAPGADGCSRADR